MDTESCRPALHEHDKLPSGGGSSKRHCGQMNSRCRDETAHVRASPKGKGPKYRVAAQSSMVCKEHDFIRLLFVILVIM